MEKRVKRWSDEEVLRLREIMTRYTVDIEGCKYAAQELGRPFSGVYAKWSQIKPNKKSIGKREEIAKILYSNISKNPGNIQEAMRITAEQTGKSVVYISNIYYKPDSPYNHHKVDTCFMMASKHKMASNAKNYDSSKMPKTTKHRIKIWIASMLGIKKEDL